MRWIVPLLLAIAPAQALHAQASHSTSGDRLSYVFFADGKGSSMASGSTDDFRRANRYRAGNAPFLYVRDGGSAYVIRDPAILARAAQIMRPQQELGKRQGALGNQQGELGRRQGELGREQGRLGALMANATVRRIGELGRQQGELGRRQAELGAQQSALGARQAELGAQQARAAKQAQPQFRALVAEAIRRGVAQRVD
jgi:hypothetical protein